MLGTKGNEYKIEIKKWGFFKCSCIDHILKNLLCKHIIYVIINIGQMKIKNYKIDLIETYVQINKNLVEKRE